MQFLSAFPPSGRLFVRDGRVRCSAAAAFLLFLLLLLLLLFLLPAQVASVPGGPSHQVVAAPVVERRTEPAPWVWPTGSRTVSRPWESPANDYAAGHRGIDVRAPVGTAAVAVADGTVTFAGPVAGRGVVTIDHGDGLRSTLDSVTPTVTTGDRVHQGDAVGRVTVGHCPASAPCLHLGARIDDRYVDPTPYLPPAAWPVLLPESAWTG